MTVIASPHAQARARERFGIDPTDADWRGVLLASTARPITRAILLGTAPQRGRTVERYLAQLCGSEVLVIWDPEPAPHEHHVVTVLDPAERYSPTIADRLERRLNPPRHRYAPNRAPRRQRDLERAELAEAEGASP